MTNAPAITREERALICQLAQQTINRADYDKEPNAIFRANKILAYESRLQQLEEALGLAWECINANAKAEINPQHQHYQKEVREAYRKAITVRAALGDPQ